MGIADSMKNITADIITSYDVRVKALGDLVADTRKTLKGFASDRKKMSKEQSSRLAAFVSDLIRSVDAMRKEFQKNHRDMSDEQTKDLANFIKDLTKNVGFMLNNFRKDRSEMSADLRKRLKKTVKEIKTYTKKRLKEFSDSHADVSEELRKDLAKFTGDIQKGVKKLLTEYAADMNKAANAWQGMSKTLDKARKGKAVVPKVEAEVKVRPVEEAIEEVGPKKKKKRGKRK